MAILASQVLPVLREHPVVAKDAQERRDRRDPVVTKAHQDRKVWMDSKAKKVNEVRWVRREAKDCQDGPVPRVCLVTRETRVSPDRLACRDRWDCEDTPDSPDRKDFEVNLDCPELELLDRRVILVWQDSPA